MDVTLAQARKDFMDRLQAGDSGVCPCCSRYGQIYKRKLNSGMARALIKLYLLAGKGEEWVSYTKVHDGSVKDSPKRDFTILRYWGLIEPQPKDARDLVRKTSGFWRITERGRDFVLERVAVPRHMLVYNDEVLEPSKENTGIRAALGNHFNYTELMNGGL